MCCEDGTWRALDSPALHRELKPAGLVYHAALRAESETRLGVVWVDRNGQADILGVPKELVEHYSKRSRAVEAEARARIAESEIILGPSLSPRERRRTYERAVLDTRDAKDRLGGLRPGSPAPRTPVAGWSGSPTRCSPIRPWFT